VDDRALAALAQSGRNLKTLILNECPRVTDTGVQALMRGCGQLRELGVDGCSISAKTARAVQSRYPLTQIW
jgi:hypothetical protein